MKFKIIRYTAFILLIGFAVEIVLLIKIGVHNHKIKNQLEEEMKTKKPDPSLKRKARYDLPFGHYLAV